MNKDNLDNVQLADIVVDGYLLGERTERVPGKTALVKLCELNYLRVPVNLNIEPVRLRSSILKENHVGSKTTAYIAGNSAEGLILIPDKWLIRSVTHPTMKSHIPNPSTAWGDLESARLRRRNRKTRPVKHCSRSSKSAVKAQLRYSRGQLLDRGRV
jgi:hypothetical protein